MSGMDLGKMVGPLPLGAWIGVVGGGFLFMVYTRKQADVVPATDSNVMTPSDPSGISGVGDGSVGGWIATTPPPTTGPTTYTTDEQWGQAATNWLIAQGYPPTVADSAIRKYLDQEHGFSAQEYALVGLALAHLGSPPVPLPAPVFGKPPTHHKPPPPPPKHKPPVHRPRPRQQHPGRGPFRYYTVRPGDTLHSIARRFHVTWQAIYNANRAGQRRDDGTPGVIHNPNIIRPGMKLIIP